VMTTPAGVALSYRRVFVCATISSVYEFLGRCTSTFKVLLSREPGSAKSMFELSIMPILMFTSMCLHPCTLFPGSLLVIGRENRFHTRVLMTISAFLPYRPIAHLLAVIVAFSLQKIEK
jgi:hypothetical protein